MDTQHNDVKLTAAELSQIWGAYQNDTASKCFLLYFLEIVEDPDIKGIVQHGLELSESHIAQLTSFFNNETYPTLTNARKSGICK